MAEDKLIKSGQVTFKRVFFLIVAGAVIVGFVYLGGRALNIGYMLLTVAICVLLYLIAIDYGINLDKVEKHAPSTNSPLEPMLATSTTQPTTTPQRRKVNRSTKRRR
ncbi:MAG: hypothetical protein AB1757_19255 [Acidobacteriota bacterium]